MWILSIDGQFYESKVLSDLLMLLALELDCGEIEDRKPICLIKVPASLQVGLLN